MTVIPIEKWQRDFCRHFIKEDTQMTNKKWNMINKKRIELLIKTMLNVHYKPPKMAKI